MINLAPLPTLPNRKKLQKKGHLKSPIDPPPHPYYCYTIFPWCQKVLTACLGVRAKAIQIRQKTAVSAEIYGLKGLFQGIYMMMVCPYMAVGQLLFISGVLVLENVYFQNQKSNKKCILFWFT